MKREDYPSIAAYLKAQPAVHRPMLEQVRRAITRALPQAEETISYKIPAFRINGQVVIYFAGFKTHYSIYPASDALLAALPGELEARRVSKGTLRFSFSEPVPEKLIERIATFRATEIRERES
jgi:uncharacterized protein YdhG (YjbR/CyaY superfamily)